MALKAAEPIGGDKTANQSLDEPFLRAVVKGPKRGGTSGVEEIWDSIAYTLFDPSTLAWCFSGALAVYLYGAFSDFYFDMNFQIIATGLIFPKTFAISNAFGRREFCLRTLARLKAHCVSLLFTFRDWDQQTQQKGNSLSSPAATNAYRLLQEMLLNMRCYLQTDDSVDEAKILYYYDNIYRCMYTNMHMHLSASAYTHLSLLPRLFALVTRYLRDSLFILGMSLRTLHLNHVSP